MGENESVIYVGDSQDVVRRISLDHASSNVEASALRRHVAEYKGWGLKKTKRPRGSTRVRIDLPNAPSAEREISSYIQAGRWRYILCANYREANEFQWYAIEKLDPLLNRARRPWNQSNEQRYKVLLEQLLVQPLVNRQEISGNNTGPGTYVLYHERNP